jgi:hypothetical protein
MTKLIKDNIDWLNAGLYCGKQGELHDKFQDLLESGYEFLEAKQKLEQNPKWQSELKGLNEAGKRAFLIGFFSAFNSP